LEGYFEMNISSARIQGFKIRHKDTGLFKDDGTYGMWSEHGYLFRTLGGVKNHLKRAVRCYPSYAKLTLEELGKWEIIQGSWAVDGTDCQYVNVNLAEGLSGGKF
jgi:hypothetical protein